MQGRALVLMIGMIVKSLDSFAVFSDIVVQLGTRWLRSIRVEVSNHVTKIDCECDPFIIFLMITLLRARLSALSLLLVLYYFYLFYFKFSPAGGRHEIYGVSEGDYSCFARVLSSSVAELLGGDNQEEVRRLRFFYFFIIFIFYFLFFCCELHLVCSFV